ncbi:HNH endonuclease [Pedobacter paludis]|uniref:HNH endonuclease n=1 Tax=Pedobacter paludis TaxID=2203212 RepID=A0A317F315_9SPHI|nr:HNH endonuclease [Pedobacter paludis]
MIINAPEQHGSYGALLFDKRWKDKRAIILMRDNNQCVICENNNDLEVHHRQYRFIKELKKFCAPWEYPDKILITLCNSCHQRGHSKFKVPVIYV